MSGKLVTIANEISSLNANLIRTRLEADGIRCFLAGETLSSTVGLPGYVGASIEIQVQAFDAARARRILREIKEAPCDGEKLKKFDAKHELQIMRVSVIGGAAFYITWQIAAVTRNWTVGMLAGTATTVIFCVIFFRDSLRTLFRSKR